MDHSECPIKDIITVRLYHFPHQPPTMVSTSVDPSQAPHQRSQSCSCLCDRGIWPDTSQQPMMVRLHSYTTNWFHNDGGRISQQWKKNTRGFKVLYIKFHFTEDASNNVHFTSHIIYVSKSLFPYPVSSIITTSSSSHQKKRKKKRNQQHEQNSFSLVSSR